MAAIAYFAQNIGNSVGKTVASKDLSWWYTPHMAAAARAILERISLVDLVLEVRDARIPLASEFEHLRNCPPSTRRIVVLNKMDLANPSQTKDWLDYFEERECPSFGINSHNKGSIKEFLNFLQARVRELRRKDHSNHTTTVMLVGIPNVGKSALANSLHQVGRICAAEKGKLKHAIVSPRPAETKDISSFKIASHPSVYVLDTPGILPPQIFDADVCTKLALTGAIADSLAGEVALAQYFLSILNSSNEHKNWARFSTLESGIDWVRECSIGSESDKRIKRQNPSDHSQDFMVQDVRGTLFREISSFNGNMEEGKDMMQLIETQLIELQKALWVTCESPQEVRSRVATKLVNLYRTGRLGHFTLDSLPANV